MPVNATAAYTLYNVFWWRWWEYEKKKKKNIIIIITAGFRKTSEWHKCSVAQTETTTDRPAPASRPKL